MSVGAVNKQTGDRIPTAGMPAIDSVLSGSSTNPVQNRVVKAALDDKQDAYETITYAEWQAMTPQQQAAKDYYISDYPSSVITAGNVSYDNTTSGMSANKVQGAIDELKSGLMSAAKAVYKDYHSIVSGDSHIFTPTLEVNHAYFVTICAGNNVVWGYCGVIFKGWEPDAAVLSDIYKGTRITATIVNTDSIQISNTDAQYDGSFEIVVIDLGRGYPDN